MKDRFITLLGALAALYIVIALFLNPQMKDHDASSRPSTEDRGENGLKALHSWLDETGVPVARLQRRYRDIGQVDGLAKSGNLLIIPLPQVTSARARDIDVLQEWVKQGNDVLFLVASSDSILNRAQHGSDDMLDRFGFSLHYRSPDREEDGKDGKAKKDKKSLQEVSENLDKTAGVDLVPLGRMPLTRGIKLVRGKTSRLSPSESTMISASGYRASLALLRDRKSRVPAFWEVRYHRSRVWVSRFGYLFSNAQLAEADNARLMANIISQSLGRKGTVIFDDMHQGITELYDEKAFFKDSRLHNTLWFIFAFWVLYVVGHTNRIAPVSPSRKLPRVVDFVEAVANLFARRLSSVASARLLFNQFFDWIRLRYGLPTNGQPVWQLLETTERLDRQDIVELKKNYSELEHNKKVNLVKLVNRMQKIRSALS